MECPRKEARSDRRIWRGLPDPARWSLKPDQRRYLIEVVQSSSLIAEVEEYIQDCRKDFRRSFWLMNAIVDLAFMPSIFALIYLRAYELIDLYEFYLAFIGLYIAAFFLIYILSRYVLARSGLDFIIIRSLANCMASIDEATESRPGSRPRRNVCKKLSRSARFIGRYSPIVPVAQYKRILAEEAIRASQALRSLNYTIMLSTSKDLKKVKELLAYTIIHVGTGNWLQVANLEISFTTPSARRRGVFSSLLPWLAGIVVPLIAALITVLGKG
jgi:hypothetical protein